MKNEKMTKTKPVIWLGTNTCAGDALSLLNCYNPGFQELITDIIDFRYNYLLEGAEGEDSNNLLDTIIKEASGGYILIVEGTIPVGSKEYYSIVGYKDGKPVSALQAVRKYAAGAGYVIAAGTCASFGGIYAASPNPSESVPLQDVLNKRVINVPGCPINPDWMVGTLLHLIRLGEPELDAFNRPKLYFGETVHNRCERRSYYNDSIFAKKPGDPWCMYKIGCKGPVTYADCPDTQWNGEPLSWPVKANTPCIGCTSPEFPDGDVPFFEHLPDIRLPGRKIRRNRFTLLSGAFTALGIGAHLTGTIIRKIKGRKK